MLCLLTVDEIDHDNLLVGMCTVRGFIRYSKELLLQSRLSGYGEPEWDLVSLWSDGGSGTSRRIRLQPIRTAWRSRGT